MNVRISIAPLLSPALLALALFGAGCPETVPPDDTPPDTGALTELRLDPTQFDLAMGQSRAVTVWGKSGGEERDVSSDAAFASGDPAVATVDAAGNVTAVAVGAATITATLGILTALSRVTVTLNVPTDGGPPVDGGPNELLDTAIDVAPPTNSSSADAAFSFACAPQGCTLECELDGAGFTSCTSPSNYTGLSDGLHVFRVRGVDEGGIADPSPSEHSWLIDTDLPETVITVSPEAVVAAGEATFEFLCDENDCVFECSLDGAGYAACGSPSIATVVDGDHIISIRAVDAAGNVDDTPAEHSWRSDTTPPETTFGLTPVDPAAASSAAFEFSCNETICDFECALDGAAYAPCLSPSVSLGLVDGSHTFDVRAVDAAGNVDASPAAFAWIIDAGVAGVTFDVVPASPTASDMGTFDFTCDIAMCVFECQLDGAGFAACATGVGFPALGDGLHTFQVRVSANATPAEHNWIVDTTSPETVIDVAPPDPTNITNVAFEFSCDELDCAFECELDGDGSSFISCTSPQNYSTLLDAEHTFRVRAIDMVGNVDGSVAEHVWTVNTDAPEVTLNGMPATRTNETSASFDFSCNEDSCTFECQLDAGAAETCNSPKVYFDLADGEHTFGVSAIDAAGNKSTVATEYVWNVDTQSPVVSISAAPPNPSNDVDATFVFSCSEGTCTFECQLDGTGFLACSTPHAYTFLPSGFHTFQVRATDSAGNQGDTTSYPWSIDLAGPQATIDTSPAATTTSTSASFTFSCDEASCDYECQIDGAAFTDCTSPADYTLSYGDHTFGVRATDTADNVGPTATRGWTIECTADGQCGTDQLCEAAACVPGNCRIAGDCGGGELCQNSFCSGCAIDSDCGPGAVCLADNLCTTDWFGTGGDGAGVVNGVVDLTKSSIVSRPVPDAPAYRVLGIGQASVSLATTPAAGALVPGDEVMVIALRGTQNWTTGERFLNNVGAWETLEVATINGAAVTFTSDVQNTYGQIDNSVLDAQRIIGLYRVPHYSSLTVNTGATLTVELFQPLLGRPSTNNVINATLLGGVLFFRVSGLLTVQSGGVIELGARGYRGGRRNKDGGDDGQAGEGLAGFSKEGCNCSDLYNKNNEPNSPLHENAGGGGSYITGAGGGYGTAGDDGTVWRTVETVPSEGGLAQGSADLTQLLFGGGGGATWNGNDNACLVLGEGPAGRGGGAMGIFARQATIDGIVSSRGSSAGYGSIGGNSFGTGAGAGGSVLFVADEVTLTGSITAIGGIGLDPVGCPGVDTPPNRAGGDGGDGRIRMDFAQLNGNDHGSSGANAALSTVIPAPGFSVHP